MLNSTRPSVRSRGEQIMQTRRGRRPRRPAANGKGKINRLLTVPRDLGIFMPPSHGSGSTPHISVRFYLWGILLEMCPKFAEGEFSKLSLKVFRKVFSAQDDTRGGECHTPNEAGVKVTFASRRVVLLRSFIGDGRGGASPSRDNRHNPNEAVDQCPPRAKDDPPQKTNPRAPDAVRYFTQIPCDNLVKNGYDNFLVFCKKIC